VKIFGLVVESYGKYVKVKTSDGEYIIKSGKKAPKEGAKIELKDFGVGDYVAKVLAKKPYNFRELPSVRFVQVAEELVEGLDFSSKERLIVAIALFLEEISKRREIDRSILQRLKRALRKLQTADAAQQSMEKKESDSDRQELENFLNYLNILSGKYGLIINEGIVFLDRETGTFEVFLKDNRIYGVTQQNSLSSSVTLYFEKIPENVTELEKRLRNNFNVVSIKLEAMRDGTYV
jgi:hypothetical protein